MARPRSLSSGPPAPAVASPNTSCSRALAGQKHGKVFLQIGPCQGAPFAGLAFGKAAAAADREGLGLGDAEHLQGDGVPAS